MRVCSVDGCADKHMAQGYCQHHYDGARRLGDAVAIKRAAKNGEHRAWLRAAADGAGGECVEWPFAKNSAGYGHTRFQGVQTGAHRVVCILAHGEPPFAWAEAAHSCNNRACCNPNHLSWKTSLDNHDDKRAHGTISRGEDLPQTVLTRAQVVEIVRQLSTRRKTHIARDFGVSVATIICIANGKTWSWLTGRNRGGDRAKAA